MSNKNPIDESLHYWVDDLSADEERDYAEVVDSMLLASSPAHVLPGGLKAKIISAALATTDAGAESSPASDLSSPDKVVDGPLVSPILPWAIAACFAIGAGLGLLSMAENGKLKARIAELESSNSALMANAKVSDLRIRDMESALDQTFKAFVVWDDARGTGVLKVENLPALGEDGDYQLWVVAEGYENPLDGGVFDTEGGRAEMPIITKKLAKDLAPAKGVTLFAISKERPGGVPISENGVFVLTAKN